MFNRIVILAIALFIGTEQMAQAYTDPGTGALIWQVVAAGFIGAMFYMRRFTSFISSRFRKRDPENK